MLLLELKDGAWVLGDLVEGAPSEELGLFRLDNGHDVAASPPDLTGMRIVRLDWPEFKFGQAFTQARLLRQRYGFAGQLRAGGKLFRDQAWHAARCGVDAFEVEDERQADGFRESLSAYTHHYQPAVTGRPAWRLREEGAA